MTGARWHRNPHLLWRRSLDAVHVLPPGLEEPVTLVGTGPELWALLAEPRRTDDIVSILAEAHGVDPSLVTADVTPILEHLEQLGVITRA